MSTIQKWTERTSTSLRSSGVVPESVLGYRDHTPERPQSALSLRSAAWTYASADSQSPTAPPRLSLNLNVSINAVSAAGGCFRLG